MTRIAVLLLLFNATPAVYADCPMSSDVDTSSYKTWSDLYSGFKCYHDHDDGDIAEGFSESVTRLLSAHWTSLPQAASLFKEDEAFRVFVLRHVEATIDDNDLRRIAAFAKRGCPKGLGSLCDDVKTSATHALQEMHSEP